jgi:dUTP pyrophosphatase
MAAQTTPKTIKFAYGDGGHGGHQSPPKRSTEGSAGVDLPTGEDFSVNPRQIRPINIGWRVEIPKGYVGLLRLRSGVSSQGLTMVSSGVIDSDYRGDLVAYVSAHPTAMARNFKAGDYLFQLVVVPCFMGSVRIHQELSETDRGKGGFGSTD